MNKVIEGQIEQNGERWAQTMDRTRIPVLLTLSRCPGATVWELTLPPNEPHPFWRVHERELTEEEAAEMKMVGCLHRVGSLIGNHLDTGIHEAWLVKALVKNGRKTEWTNSVEKVRVIIEN